MLTFNRGLGPQMSSFRSYNISRLFPLVTRQMDRRCTAVLENLEDDNEPASVGTAEGGLRGLMAFPPLLPSDFSIAIRSK
jgi:hypothetical protein